MISIFGLSHPELVSVFDNPKYYFRFCFIDNELGSFGENEMKQKLNNDLTCCKWFDCLGRRVYIPLSALEEVEKYLEEKSVFARAAILQIETIVENKETMVPPCP